MIPKRTAFPFFSFLYNVSKFHSGLVSRQAVTPCKGTKGSGVQKRIPVNPRRFRICPEHTGPSIPARFLEPCPWNSIGRNPWTIQWNGGCF